MKNILITGAGSYVGTSLERYLSACGAAGSGENYRIDTVSQRDDLWKTRDFSLYDTVFHVTGIAHADVGSVTEEGKRQYYQINRDLAVETAQKAKAEGVRQFIFMSSIIVYSGCREKLITADTVPTPLNFYGDSKWQADQKIQALGDEKFKVVILRPPMIYGRGSKGNYPQLAKLAGKLPFFPRVKNKRSMLYIDNLCEFVRLMMENEESGVFFPQNAEYVETSRMVQLIAGARGHRLVLIPANAAVKLLCRVPGKIGELAGKAFGDLAYEMEMSEYSADYRVRTLEESVRLTEGGKF